MTEEIKAPDGEIVPEDKPEQDDAPKFTEIEKRAIEMGWRPKDEFSGDEIDFVDAKEFVGRAPLFTKIEGQSKEIKSIRKALEALKTHYTTVQETEYKRALSALKSQRQEAVSNADGVAFDKIDGEIKQVETAMAQVKEAQNTPIAPEPQVPPEFAAWQNRNQWYQASSYMRSWADEQGTKLAAQGMSPRDVLRKIEDDVKNEFPNKFVNPNKAYAPHVEGSKTTRTGTGGSKDTFELSEMERNIMNTLIRNDPKTFTKEKYIAELKMAKGIK